MKFMDALKQALFEEEEKKEEKKETKTKKYVKGLKLFYVVDVNLSEPEENPEEQPVTTDAIPETPPVAPPVAPAPVAAGAIPPTESFEEKVNILVEENILEKLEGVLTVPEADVDNIQTLEDLLDYVSDKKSDNGKPIIDEFVIETIYTATGITNTSQLGDLLQKDDKILIDIDYGTNKKDSIGIKVLKRSGVNNISIMLKKNGNIIPAKFNLQDFNNQIIIFRNSIFGEVK